MPLRQADPMDLARRLADECERELGGGDEARSLAALSRRFREELTPDLEYIVLMSPEGRTHVHTNKLREGRVYADKVNLAAAAIRTATTQRYDRNTGEVIREAVVPVARGGSHYAVLRVGQIVPRGSVRTRVAASLGAAAAVPAVTAAIVAGPAPGLAALGAGAACAGGLAVWNWSRITLPVRRFTETARAVTAGDLTATVTGAGRDELGQMGFELNKVVLGLQKVIEAGVKSSGAASELAGKMAGSTGQTATAMAQIAASCQETHRSAEAQSLRAEDAVGAAERVSLGLASTVESAGAAQSLLEEARASALSGGESLRRATGAMDAVSRAVGDGTASVEALRERSRQIESIVDAISTIAAQTNLLALNAAIEGARAGEQGRGFMVVAEEVRSLAEQADGAARSIRDLVAEVQAETARAVAAMGAGTGEVATATGTVDEVAAAVVAIAARLDEVAAAVGAMEGSASALAQDAGLLGEVTGESAQLASATVEATESITAATQQSAAVSEVNARSAQELSEISAGLRELVGRFRVA